MDGKNLVPRDRGATPLPREELKKLVQLKTAAIQHQAVVCAVSSVTECALTEAAYLTRLRNQLEATVPDATEALALIATAANMSLARIVHRFGSEVS